MQNLENNVRFNFLIQEDVHFVIDLGRTNRTTYICIYGGPRFLAVE
jgi:hypothetical protein